MGLQWYVVIGYHMLGLPGAFYIACARTIFVHIACTKGHFDAAATAGSRTRSPSLACPAVLAVRAGRRGRPARPATG